MNEKQIASFVLNNGKQYTPALLPRDIHRGKLGDCFDHCFYQARMSNGKYRYAEGLASDPENKDWYIVHAWLTDGENAYDPTWQAHNKHDKEVALPVIYIGVEFDIVDVARFLQATGYKSLLYNNHRDPELWQDIMGRTIGKMGLIKS